MLSAASGFLHMRATLTLNPCYPLAIDASEDPHFTKVLADLMVGSYCAQQDGVDMPKSKLVSFGEGAALLGLVIKVVQTIGEQVGLKERFPAFFNSASSVSLLLFGLSLVMWLNSSRKGLEKVEVLAQRVEDIKRELDDVDHIARYGRGPVYLAGLLRSGGFLHGQAGGETLSEVFLHTYAAIAEDLYELTRGTKDRVEFVEYHIVDKFLLNLMRTLPVGSVWLGTTKLDEPGAWEKGHAEPSYFQFQELVEQRTRRREINYFRLWCFDSAARQADLVATLRSQSDAGLCQRTCVNALMPDMSVIWVPENTSAAARRPTCSPESFTQAIANNEYTPLCAIEFRARGGKELDAMTLHSPKSDDFMRLRKLFMQGWQSAEPVA